MPPITPPAMTGDRIDGIDEMLSVFRSLNEQGWRGFVTAATVPGDPEPLAGWSIQVSKPSDIPGGLEPRLEARVGDVVIRVEDTITAIVTMTVYESTYGPYPEPPATDPVSS